MSTKSINLLEAEIREINIGILGSEGWAPGYAAQPEYFKRLLEIETDMEKLVRDYFRGLGQRIGSYIAWKQYHADVVAVAADDKPYDVNVLFDSDGFDQDEQTQLQTMIREIYINGVAIGYAAEQASLTEKPVIITRTVESPAWQAIQETSEEHVQQLAQWLDKTTANMVVQSIQESVALGESQELAMQRLKDHVSDLDGKRAERIARTESVRAWSVGARKFANLTGATHKKWRSLPGADEHSKKKPCLENNGSRVPIDEAFPSGDDDTPAHVNCRCKVDYIYPDDYVIPES